MPVPRDVCDYHIPPRLANPSGPFPLVIRDGRGREMASGRRCVRRGSSVRKSVARPTAPSTVPAEDARHQGASDHHPVREGARLRRLLGRADPHPQQQGKVRQGPEGVDERLSPRRPGDRGRRSRRRSRRSRRTRVTGARSRPGAPACVPGRGQEHGVESACRRRVLELARTRPTGRSGTIIAATPAATASSRNASMPCR